MRSSQQNQQRILDFIKKEIEQKGYPPSVREICAGVGLKSTSTVHAHLNHLEEEVSTRTGCDVKITTGQGYPAVINPPEVAKQVRASGIDYQELVSPAMTTEDFAWYQRYLPGMFFFLGAGETPTLHNSNFNFDEAVLEAGANFFENLALHYRNP